MLTVRSPIFLALLLALSALTGVQAAPQRNRGGRTGGRTGGNRNGGGRNGATRATPQQQAAQIPQGISQATDGSMILDTTATVKYVVLLLSHTSLITLCSQG